MAGTLFSSGSSNSSSGSVRSALVLSRAPPRNYGSLLTYQFLKSARTLGLNQVTARPSLRGADCSSTTKGGLKDVSCKASMVSPKRSRKGPCCLAALFPSPNLLWMALDPNLATAVTLFMDAPSPAPVPGSGS